MLSKIRFVDASTLADSFPQNRFFLQIVPSSFITCAGSELKELVLIAELLAETPTVEQVSTSFSFSSPRLVLTLSSILHEGFVDRGTGPTEWNWEAKTAEVRWVIEGMQQTAYLLGVTSQLQRDVLDVS